MMAIGVSEEGVVPLVALLVFPVFDVYFQWRVCLAGTGTRQDGRFDSFAKYPICTLIVIQTPFYVMQPSKC